MKKEGAPTARRTGQSCSHRSTPRVSEIVNGPGGRFAKRSPTFTRRFNAFVILLALYRPRGVSSIGEAAFRRQKEPVGGILR